MQVSHLLLPITKRLHYFYANKAILIIVFINIYFLIWEIASISIISTLYLKMFSFLQLKPIHIIY
jgi:hypothetical protein